MLRRLILGIALSIAASAIGSAVAQGHDAPPHFRVTRHIRGPDGLWDYASVDEQSRRLFVGRQGGILELDVDDPHAVPTVFFEAPVVHQVLPIGHERLLATTGESDVLAIFHRRALVARVPLSGHDPDSVAYDQKTGLAITFNRGSRNATIVDPDTAQATGSLQLPGAPEFSVSDGQGTVYVNIADKAKIAAIDLLQKRILRLIDLAGCREPSGLALDPQMKLLISACDNGIAKFVSTDGRDHATLKIGESPDAVFIDARHRLAFIPSGASGTLAVISLSDPQKIAVLQTVKTQHGTRTGAVNPQTGKVYLPTGKVKPPVPPAKWPEVLAGSFEILEISP